MREGCPPIYLDNAASTRPSRRVLERVLDHLRGPPGNASSETHAPGRRARAALEQARSEVATLLGAGPEDAIVFTSGGTEANNLALFGLAQGRAEGHIVSSAIEHPSILRPLEALRARGVQVTLVPVDGCGRVDPQEVARALRPDTFLISIMVASNELGTLQPLGELAAIARGRGIPLHRDGVQAACMLDVDANRVGADLLSISGHKMHAIQGIGALLVRSQWRDALRPMHLGGDQGEGLRGGTENVPGALALGESARIALLEREGTRGRVEALRDRLERRLRSIPESTISGPGAGERLPGLLHVAFEGVRAEDLMAATPELAFSRGSACSARREAPSHVLQAIGASPRVLHGGVRLSLSGENTSAEIDSAASILEERVMAIR
ncbi:MAG: cysteine desulfurase, partial [Myxococcales bacterium]|nr:cysteine desulfurase [Myxococcales bacterium]